jgi:hypothetical protein
MVRSAAAISPRRAITPASGVGISIELTCHSGTTHAGRIRNL